MLENWINQGLKQIFLFLISYFLLEGSMIFRQTLIDILNPDVVNHTIPSQLILPGDLKQCEREFRRLKS
jgi:hypothetical protein